MSRHIAPAGTPITPGDLAVWTRNLVSFKDSIQNFKEMICERYGVRYCFFVASGRSALYILLKTMREMSDNGKNEVIMPSYTCFSVPSSVARAGLKIRVIDIDPETLDYDLEILSSQDFSNVLCILSSNLYGIPNDLTAINRLAQENGVMLIDDAAQCMGGTISGRYSGTFGDAGIFSLDKGKTITTIQGGIIVTNSRQLASRLNTVITSLPSPSIARTVSYALKILIYSMFLKPNLYWLPAGLPFLELGGTLYTTDYPVEGYSMVLGAMGRRLFEKIDEINRARVRNAETIKDGIKGLDAVRHTTVAEHINPVYLRLPLLARDSEVRDALLNKLNVKHLGASASYPHSVIDISEIRPIINLEKSTAQKGRELSRHIITLPTHPYVTDNDTETMIDTIRSFS